MDFTPLNNYDEFDDYKKCKWICLSLLYFLNELYNLDCWNYVRVWSWKLKHSLITQGYNYKQKHQLFVIGGKFEIELLLTE